jgi:hypothetical protein
MRKVETETVVFVGIAIRKHRRNIEVRSKKCTIHFWVGHLLEGNVYLHLLDMRMACLPRLTTDEVKPMPNLWKP